MDIRLHPESDKFDGEDPRWLGQVNDLYRELKQSVDGFRKESTTAPKGKGVAETVILALGSAGAFSAAVTCFKAWLGRDKHRRLTVTWTQDGMEQRIVLEGQMVDAESMRRLSESIAQRLGGASWPASTEHS
jgi:hypothetical protein